MTVRELREALLNLFDDSKTSEVDVVVELDRDGIFHDVIKATLEHDLMDPSITVLTLHVDTN